MKNRIRVLSRALVQADLRNVSSFAATVSAIENGKYDPSLPLAFRIREVFGLPIEEIFIYEDGGSAGR